MGQVSIPDIVCNMAGKNPVHEMADFDRHYMPGGTTESQYFMSSL